MTSYVYQRLDVLFFIQTGLCGLWAIQNYAMGKHWKPLSGVQERIFNFFFFFHQNTNKTQ